MPLRVLLDPMKRARLSPFTRDLVSLAALALIITAARSSLADHYHVPTGSMEPTVLPGDHLIVDKRAYDLRVPLTSISLMTDGEPARGDVVVLESPENGIVLLKRVVALPGDVVELRGENLWLNGQAAPIVVQGDGWSETLGERVHPLDLSYGGGPPLPPTRVPEGAYLVLGDNRGNSHDGRSFGLVPRKALLGRAIAVVFREGSLAWEPL